LIDLVFGSSAEAALLRALWASRPVRRLSWPGLQIEAPVHRHSAGTNLHFFVSGLEPKHLDFDGIGPRRKIGQFVLATLIGSSHRAMAALSSDHRCARQRLPPELHCASGCDADLRAKQRTE